MKTYVVYDNRTNTRYELGAADIRNTKEADKHFFITTNKNEKIACDFIMCFIE